MIYVLQILQSDIKFWRSSVMNTVCIKIMLLWVVPLCSLADIVKFWYLQGERGWQANTFIHSSQDNCTHFFAVTHTATATVLGPIGSQAFVLVTLWNNQMYGEYGRKRICEDLLPSLLPHCSQWKGGTLHSSLVPVLCSRYSVDGLGCPS